MIDAAESIHRGAWRGGGVAAVAGAQQDRVRRIGMLLPLDNNDR